MVCSEVQSLALIKTFTAHYNELIVKLNISELVWTDVRKITLLCWILKGFSFIEEQQIITVDSQALVGPSKYTETIENVLFILLGTVLVLTGLRPLLYLETIEDSRLLH